ncbi:hypothetical protein MMC25_004623 [Agyrium rufum]|nr:hypothetical protein [Agyrium rufum]
MASTRYPLYERSARGQPDPTTKDIETTVHSQSCFKDEKKLLSPGSVMMHFDQDRLPVCLLITGPAVMTYGAIYEKVAEQMSRSGDSIAINLTASDCSNLKSALKAVNLKGTEQIEEGDDDVEDMKPSKRTRLLNYDLQILYDHIQRYGIEKVLISFQSSEAIDGNVLADLIDVFRSWKDRLPLVLLFEVATSTENFQQKLPQSILRHLTGTEFETMDAEESLELIFRAVTAPDVERSLWLSPALSKTLLDRQTQNIQSAQALIESCKYALMMHFFANPLSVLYDATIVPEALQTEHLVAVRALGSVQRYMESLAAERPKEAAALQQDNVLLAKSISQLLKSSRESIENLLRALDVYSQIQSYTSESPPTPWADLYIQGMSATLTDSSSLRQALISVRQMSSDTMSDLLERLADTPILAPSLEPIQNDLADLLSDLQADDQVDDYVSLRSAYSKQSSSLHTTVVGARVRLAKHSHELTSPEKTYTKIVDRVDSALKAYFNTYLINPRDLPLSEILLVDSRQACREAFAPAPRYAVQRALATPHDYLACECCAPSNRNEVDGGLSSLAPTQPVTAVLYQLVGEAGALVNIGDLWAAFKAVLGSADTKKKTARSGLDAMDEDEHVDDEGEEEEREDEEEDDERRGQEEERILALFYRAMAELRHLGMIKNSRKKIDHVAKTSWKGL